MIYFDSEPTGALQSSGDSSSSILRLHTGNSNSDIGLLSSPPTKPYLVVRAGGKNCYVKLVPPSDSNASKIRIHIGGTTYALAKKEVVVSDVDYGTGTQNSNGVELIWDDYYNLYIYESAYCMPLYSLNSASPHILTNDMTDVMSYGINADGGEYWYSGRDGFGWHYYLSDVCSVGDQLLFHHSECKGTSNSYDGKWEIRKVVAVSNNSITLDQAPDLDLENYYVQIQPFSMYKNLTLRTYEKEEFGHDVVYDEESGGYLNGNINVQVEEFVFSPPYSYEYHCGGLLAVKVNETLTFSGGYVDASSKPPCGDNLFLFAKNIATTGGYGIDIRN